MAKRQSKLKEMAEAGNPWAIETLAKAQALGREASLRGWAMKRKAPLLDEEDPENIPLMEAVEDAKDILKWHVGPKPARWRIRRLAQALIDAQRAR